MKLFLIQICVIPLLMPGQIAARQSSEILDDVDIFSRFGSIPQELFEDSSAGNYPYEFLEQLTSVRLEETDRGIVAVIDNLVRIKIHSGEPIYIAEASMAGIPFYYADGIERVINLEGITHHPDGTQTALNASLARTAELNSRYRILEFEMPNAGQGDILEYKYTMERRYIEELPDFYFTNRVPTRKAAFYLTNSDFARYTTVPQNIDFEITYQEHRVDTSSVPLVFTYTRPDPVFIQSWEAEHITAADVSSFIASVDDIRAKLKFQISEFGLPRQPLENSWEFVTAQILRNDNTYSQITTVPEYEELGQSIASNLSQETAILDSIFHYVNTHAQFNGQKSVFPGAGLARVFDDEPTAQAEINITLLAMLKGARIEAKPAYLSSRNFGRINEEFPSLFQLNSMMIVAEADGDEYFLDASYPNSLPGLIPIDMYNGRALVLSDSSHTWKNIEPDKSNFYMEVHIDGALAANGTLSGRLQATTAGYPSQQMRAKYSSGTPDRDIISETFFEAYPNVTVTAELVEINPDYPDSIHLQAEFEIPDYAISFAEGLEFTPMVVGYLYDNPFEATVRNVPVTLDAPENLSFSYNIQLPRGYRVPPAGETRSTNLAGASLFEEYITEGQAIEYSFDINITQKEFPAHLYGQLRELYNRWVELSTNSWFIETQ